MVNLKNFLVTGNIFEKCKLSFKVEKELILNTFQNEFETHVQQFFEKWNRLVTNVGSVTNFVSEPFGKNIAKNQKNLSGHNYFAFSNSFSTRCSKSNVFLGKLNFTKNTLVLAPLEILLIPQGQNNHAHKPNERPCDCNNHHLNSLNSVSKFKESRKGLVNFQTNSRITTLIFSFSRSIFLFSHKQLVVKLKDSISKKTTKQISGEKTYFPRILPFIISIFFEPFRYRLLNLNLFESSELVFFKLVSLTFKLFNLIRKKKQIFLGYAISGNMINDETIQNILDLLSIDYSFFHFFKQNFWFSLSPRQTIGDDLQFNKNITTFWEKSLKIDHKAPDYDFAIQETKKGNKIWGVIFNFSETTINYISRKFKFSIPNIVLFSPFFWSIRSMIYNPKFILLSEIGYFSEKIQNFFKFLLLNDLNCEKNGYFLNKLFGWGNSIIDSVLQVLNNDDGPERLDHFKLSYYNFRLKLLIKKKNYLRKNQ